MESLHLKKHMKWDYLLKSKYFISFIHSFINLQYEEAILASGITKVEYDKDVFGEGQGIFIGTFGNEIA